MPQGKTFSRKQGRWLKIETEKAYDYSNIDKKSAALFVNFFRWYPDYFADLCRSPNATYSLELPQRLMMRVMARYRTSYITGVRGLTKTYTLLLEKCIEGLFFPGEIMRYSAPNQKQAASLAAQAFAQIKKDYPLIAEVWKEKNNRGDLFRITTDYGSEFTMYAPRGDNCSQTIAEEIGQEGEDAFDMDKYEKDILPTCRIVRKVNQKNDTVHINLKHTHISNACSKINRAYSVHRNSALKEMKYGAPFGSFVCDMSWVVALIGNLRDISYIEDMKNKLTQANWQREMCALYAGTSESPLITEETLMKARTLDLMEDRHCGDLETIYIVSHDVSYEEGTKNAECADVVLKLTKYKVMAKRDKFKKEVVYVDSYPPPKTAYLQAKKVRDLWRKYCNNEAEATYLVIDAHAYGREIVEELMKPTTDGSAPLCCYNHLRYAEIEQPRALPIIYPLKAGGKGFADDDSAMVQYAQLEFEQGNVHLLTSNLLDGLERYKEKYFIKDESANGAVLLPYKKTDKLCQQIMNLKAVVKGASFKEERKTRVVQRDIWSALKYALRFAQLLEDGLKKERYKAQSTWKDAIEKFSASGAMPNSTAATNRQALLKLRRTK